jgi:outer membrane protein, adhesin transport system
MNQISQMRIKQLSGIKHFASLVLFLFIVNNSIAQEVYDLSRCIKTGLERNFSLLVARNNEEIASNNFTRGNAGMLPTITSTNSFGGTAYTTNQNYEDGSKVTTNSALNNTSSAYIDLGMTIFKGFQVQRTYQKLNEQRELEGFNTQMSVENLVSQIVSQYNYHIQQLILNDNLAYAVSLSRERVRIDRQRYLLGGASKLEMLQSIVYLNSDSSRLENQNEVLRTSQIRLNELMAVSDLGENIKLKDTLIQLDQKLLYDDLLQQTLQNNTSLRIAAKKQVITELDAKIIKSRSYPYLTMSSGYGYTYYRYGAGTLINKDVHGLDYGLTLGINIFDGLNRKREKSNALIEIQSKKIQYKEVEQEVKADLLTIYFAYENNLRLLKLEEQNLSVARENLDIALARYKLGALSGLELREVQKSLLDAEERLVSVQYQTKIAEISLFQISGRIMEYI